MKYRTEIVLHAFGNGNEKETDQDLARFIAPVVQDRFHLPASVGRPLAVPDLAFSAERGQYHATRLLQTMEQAFHSDPNIHLGLTDLDLYVPDLTYVFGEASPATWVAVISTHRLKSQSALAVFRQRATREAVHELGHVFGLRHCNDPRCVMWFSNEIGETDRKSSQFCDSHRLALEGLLRQWRSQAPSHYSL